MGNLAGLRGKALTLGIGLLGGALLLPPGVAMAEKVVQDVLVKNTTANPVPTAAQGTTNVAGTVHVGNSVGVSGTVGIDPANNQVSVASSESSPVVVDDRSQPYQVTVPLHETDCGFFHTVIEDSSGAAFRLEGVTISQDYFHADELAVTVWGLVRDQDPSVERLVALAQATNLGNLHEVENVETNILIHPNTREAASPGQVYAVVAEMCLDHLANSQVWVTLTGTTI